MNGPVYWAAGLALLVAAAWYASTRLILRKQTRLLRRELEQQTHREKELRRTQDLLDAQIGKSGDELETANEQLRRQAEERARAVERLQRLNLLKEALLEPGRLEEKLRHITDSLAEIFDVDFCRIWLVKPGDLCDSGCIHAAYDDGPHACRDRGQCLHLMASSGKHAREDSKMHHRVPFGCYKIGRVGAGQDKKFLTNDIAGDRRVPNPKWASGLGLVSFAGYKLTSPLGETMGVLAFFAKRAILPEEDALIENMAASISEAIQTAQAGDDLRESEQKFRTLYEGSSDAVMLFRDGHLIDCNQSAIQTFGWPDPATYIGMTLIDLSPPAQPDGHASEERAQELLDEAGAEGMVRFEWIYRRGDGTEFPADVILTGMDLNGRFVVQAVVRDMTERKQAEEEREKLIAELQDALAKIKTLKGLIPICASCKKIRDDTGYWKQIETYIHDHSDAEFSHGICPECIEKLYPQYAKKREERAQEDGQDTPGSPTAPAG